MSKKHFSKTKIVATIGPAASSKEMMDKLIDAGADVLRINASHGEHAVMQQIVQNIREINEQNDSHIAILFDLQGPKIRLGIFKNDMKVKLSAGDKYRFELGDFEGDEKIGSLPQPEIFSVLSKGLDLLVDDGKVRLKVTEFGESFAEVKCIRGGFLSNRKDVNVPGAILPISALTEKDEKI